jgi:site-specific DNA-adenine methylase
MFSYYGSKSKIVNYYPPPKHKLIIEPFAGSARYSLKYWRNDILLVDKYPVVIEVWKYLQQCTPADILKLPKPLIGDDLRKYEQLSEIEKKFMGFIVQAAQGKPANTVTKMSAFYANTSDIRDQIAGELYKIKHWVIMQGCYKDIPNDTCTWFIDPPYQYGGQHQYKFNNKSINFEHLAEWCKTRNGQAIVCENTKADWMPFKPMVELQGAANTNTTEAIWSNIPTNYDNEQLNLF